MELTVAHKDGADANGSQTVWKRAEMISASDHLFQCNVLQLTVPQGSRVLWKNPSPNSATVCYPAYLLRASEDDAHINGLIFPATDV